MRVDQDTRQVRPFSGRGRTAPDVNGDFVFYSPLCYTPLARKGPTAGHPGSNAWGNARSACRSLASQPVRRRPTGSAVLNWSHRLYDGCGAVQHRLEERIRTLCAKLIEAQDDSERFRHLSTELREALNEHTLRLRAELIEFPLTTERRRSSEG
jgi:hypothetical protein